MDQVPPHQLEAVDARWAFERYEQLLERLPRNVAAGAAQLCGNLGDLLDRFDAFVFDSFGVLNVGEHPIDGAAERIAMLRAEGKQVFVLTNAATSPLASLPEKYTRLGIPFAGEEIISSRGVLSSALGQTSDPSRWLAIAPAHSKMEELGVSFTTFGDAEVSPEELCGILFMSSQAMDEPAYARLVRVLSQKPMPVLVGNPDLVAPRAHGYSLEPGYYAHRLADELGIEPEFYGKPFSNAFDAVKTRIDQSIPAARVAMIGDTLHTDILGGAAAGFGTVLVTQHGVLKELDVERCLAVSGILPDYILPSI